LGGDNIVSKISISGAATGTATFTIESPATNTNRTLTLPDATGTLALTGAASNKIEEGDSKVEVTDAGTGKVEVTVDNVEVADFTTGAIVFNETGANQDFRVEGDGNANLIFADASADRVGIGIGTPSNTLHVFKAGDGQTPVQFQTGNANGLLLFYNDSNGWSFDSGGDLRFVTTRTGSGSPTRMSISAAGAVNVVGALSKGSGSFKIDHPLKPETHHLIHSFIEGPQADLIYRGKVELVAGRAEINIDTVSNMTEGTFVVLNREVQCFTSNESDWDAVRGSVTGNILTIECQNAESTATISWMVIGERQDQHMYDTDWTDENGKVIVEPLKPVKETVETA
jgi:hypothetical protein